MCGIHGHFSVFSASSFLHSGQRRASIYTMLFHFEAKAFKGLILVP